MAQHYSYRALASGSPRRHTSLSYTAPDPQHHRAYGDVYYSHNEGDYSPPSSQGHGATTTAAQRKHTPTRTAVTAASPAHGSPLSRDVSDFDPYAARMASTVGAPGNALLMQQNMDLRRQHDLLLDRCDDLEQQLDTQHEHIVADMYEGTGLPRGAAEAFAARTRYPVAAPSPYSSLPNPLAELDDMPQSPTRPQGPYVTTGVSGSPTGAGRRYSSSASSPTTAATRATASPLLPPTAEDLDDVLRRAPAHTFFADATDSRRALERAQYAERDAAVAKRELQMAQHEHIALATRVHELEAMLQQERALRQEVLLRVQGRYHAGRPASPSGYAAPSSGSAADGLPVAAPSIDEAVSRVLGSVSGVPPRNEPRSSPPHSSQGPSSPVPATQPTAAAAVKPSVKALPLRHPTDAAPPYLSYGAGPSTAAAEPVLTQPQAPAAALLPPASAATATAAPASPKKVPPLLPTIGGASIALQASHKLLPKRPALAPTAPPTLAAPTADAHPPPTATTASAPLMMSSRGIRSQTSDEATTSRSQPEPWQPPRVEQRRIEDSGEPVAAHRCFEGLGVASIIPQLDMVSPLPPTPLQHEQPRGCDHLSPPPSFPGAPPLPPLPPKPPRRLLRKLACSAVVLILAWLAAVLIFPAIAVLTAAADLRSAALGWYAGDESAWRVLQAGQRMLYELSSRKPVDA